MSFYFQPWTSHHSWTWVSQQLCVIPFDLIFNSANWYDSDRCSVFIIAREWYPKWNDSWFQMCSFGSREFYFSFKCKLLAAEKVQVNPLQSENFEVSKSHLVHTIMAPIVWYSHFTEIYFLQEKSYSLADFRIYLPSGSSSDISNVHYNSTLVRRNLMNSSFLSKSPIAIK